MQGTGMVSAAGSVFTGTFAVEQLHAVDSTHVTGGTLRRLTSWTLFQRRRARYPIFKSPEIGAAASTGQCYYFKAPTCS